jgi:MSHA pilin protein MshC
MKHSGFTLFELIIVMLIVGILAAFAAPRLNLTTFRETGFLQQATAAIRYAQKQAIASGCTVQVDISGSNCNLNWVGCAGNASLRNPANNNTNFCSDSEPAGNPNASFSFDNIGRPSSAQSINFGNGIIIVEAETGYVH